MAGGGRARESGRMWVCGQGGRGRGRVRGGGRGWGGNRALELLTCAGNLAEKSQAFTDI